MMIPCLACNSPLPVNFSAELYNNTYRLATCGICKTVMQVKISIYAESPLTKDYIEARKNVRRLEKVIQP